MSVRTTVPVTAAAVVLGLSSCASGDSPATQAAGQQTPDPTASSAEVEVPMQDSDGADVGRVVLAASGDGTVVVDALLRDLEPGWHGFHVHTDPECDPDAPDGAFTTAGGHYAPDGGEHPEHAGDLPPLLARADGRAQTRVVTDRFTVDDLTAAGAAVVVHAQPDNLAHVPDRYDTTPDQQTRDTGDAGDRAACGVVP